MFHGVDTFDSSPQQPSSSRGRSDRSGGTSRVRSGVGNESAALGTSPSLRTEPLLSEQYDADIISELEGIVDDHRNGKSSKLQAISNLFERLNYRGGSADPQKEKTLELYISSLSNIDCLPDSSVHPTGPKHTLPGDLPTTLPLVDKKVDDLVQRLSSKSNASDSDSDNDLDEPRKRRKVDESKMPWYASQLSLQSQSDPSCRETCRLLEYYERDRSQVKSWIKRHPGAPLGFPPSQWDRIIKGEPVDLNVVFSNLHRTEPVKESAGRVGDTVIHFALPEPKKRVETAGDWTAAFNRVVRATAFAFPHREHELRDYGDYIEEFFAAKIPAVHPRIIMYDNAIRSEVGGGHSILLTDFHKFHKFYQAILASDGSDAGPRRSNGRSSKPGSSKVEICHRFNSSGCPFSDLDCHRKHVCKNCKRPGHGASSGSCEKK